MNFTFHHIFRDYVELNAATRTALIKRVCVFIGAVVMASMALFFPTYARTRTELCVAILPWAGVLVIFGILTPQMMAIKVYASARRLGALSVQVTVTEAQVSVKDAHVEDPVEVPWTDFDGRVRTKNLIVLWHRRLRMSLAFPLRDLRAAGVEEEFNALAQRVPVTRRIGF